MGNIFKASEVLEFAVRIEDNGEYFYKTSANEVSDAKLKDLLLLLADEEVKHRNTFQKLLKTVEDYKPQEAYPDEYFLYLKAFADQHIFVKKEDILKKIKKSENNADIIDIALGLEVDSILYYLELKNMVPSDEKTVIDSIIEEERTHFQKLTEIKKAVR